MVFPIVLLKLVEWVLYQFLATSFYRAASKMKTTTLALFFKNPSLKSSQIQYQSHNHSQQQQQQQQQEQEQEKENPPSLSFPEINKFSTGNFSHNNQTTLVCDIQGFLLRKTRTHGSFFPYFMLVAFEGGSIIRAFLLLFLYPILCLLKEEWKLKVMIFVTFCGLKVKEVQSVGRAVLPKFYLENLHARACEVVVGGSRSSSVVVFTRVPRVMVEGFLKEYLSVERVVGTELTSVKGYFTGLVSGSGLVVKHKALLDHFGDRISHVVVGLGNSGIRDDQLFLSLCEAAYVLNDTEEEVNDEAVVMTRDRYPKPLVFHDGRLAFLPTPLASLSMFLWIPLAIPLVIFRLSIGVILPYKLSLFLGTLSGVIITLKGHPPYKRTGSSGSGSGSGGGILYVCNHRTLLDPVFLTAALAKSLTAVTYSLSKMSEIIAPIPTVRLTRERNTDGETMQRLLTEGDLIVCPEGTTCREPYLLRFSSLFAELADEIVPVAMDARVSMFYGTTASGFKCLDPIFFLMNPRPEYHIWILDKLPRELTCAGGKSSCDVANYIQRQLGDALGFECTNLTRKDKYLMLAGNDGIVRTRS